MGAKKGKTKKSEEDLSKKKAIFRTWNDWCLIKLKEIGRSTQLQWAAAMGYTYSCSMDKIIKNNIDKLEITKLSDSRLKFFKIKEDINFKRD